MPRAYPTDYAPQISSGSRTRTRQKAIWRLRRDPLGQLAALRRQQGDIACFKLGRQRVFYLSDAEVIEEIFVGQTKNIDKWGRAKRWWIKRPPTYVRGRLLSTHDRQSHLSLRRGLQPSFRAQHAEQDVEVMEQIVIDTLKAKGSDPFDLYLLCETINASATITSLTDIRLSPEEEVALVGALHDLDSPPTHRFFSPGYGLLDFLRRPRPFSGHSRLAEMTETFLKRGRGGRPDSLPAVCERIGLSDEEGGDIILGSLVSGYSVSAAALAILTLYSAEAEFAQRFRDELHSTIGDRPLKADDLAKLPLCHNLILETLRFTGGWQISRICQQPFTVRGVHFRPGDWLLATPFWLQRDHRYFTDPERFWPERWSDPSAPKRPRLAYMPFGVGGRKCIGAEVIVTLMFAYLGALRHFEVKPDRGPGQVRWYANKRGEFSLAAPLPAVVKPL